MNVTKLAGYLVILLAVGYLVVTLADFGPEYAAAGSIGEDAEKYGLKTGTTNLRFKIGLEFFLDVIIIGVIVIAGWWLLTTEVVQIIWIILVGVFILFSIVVRATPILPLNVVKLSPGAAFYGAQVQVPIYDDLTMHYPRQYVVITRKQTVRTARSATPDGKASHMVVLDFPRRRASDEYNGCTLPLTVTGNVRGTGAVAKGNQLTAVPLIVVNSAKSGMPQKK